MKHPSKMDFNDFVTWAQGHIFEALLDGGVKEMRRATYTVVLCAKSNEVFGGADRKDKKRKQ